MRYSLPKFRIKLDLGAGKVSPPGFVPVGRDHGTEIFPLNYADGSVDEIRCSHALEHFPHAQIPEVIKDWVRCLKKGGKLKIAVPDFGKIAEDYLAGKPAPYEGYVVGGQIDQNDYHKALFDRERLRKLLADAGLVLTRPWTSEIEDCAAYPISLNLEARKPFVDELRVSGAMSMPRLAFTDNFFCCMEACIPCNVKLRKHGGAFWGQSMTKVFERILEEDDPDAILTIDYDSVFLPKHLAHLMQLLMLHPEIDALAPIQSSRHLPTTLFTVHGKEGDNAPALPRTAFEGDTVPVATAHFGLTLIRTEALRRMEKPWFQASPDSEGRWGEGKVDEDIGFWRRWEAAGNSLHLASHVPIGHMELLVKWPDINLQTFHQSVTDFQINGVPEGVWE
ncbi:methyltransferase domain-containing protein [Bradyrhizobium elkanii]|uniref:methyltransferase domain-containing protein n=1 Tax=Bradyrhizobium elkanii TaxID=29448 RepID=UPI00216875F3|nr:methyltransferase domain-containing protein [Bradyrhizobium elkanii]MCS3690942.1 putative SAM-dependent methyltransferase [Bradyrhizobium elkanii]